MNEWLSSFDFEKTLMDYEYTMRAEQNMRMIYDSDEFLDQDAKTLFEYLFRRMELVSFGDYLKRYIYERAEMTESFTMVPDKAYQEIIIDSFRENNTPFSYEPTTRKTSVIVKQWITGETIKRKNVFLLGFGLRMEAEDVTMFLKKIIKEQDFNFHDEQETIAWYCYRNGLGFPAYQKLLQHYEALEDKSSKNGGTEAMLTAEGPKIRNEKDLWNYLAVLKAEKAASQHTDRALEQFCRLLEQVKEEIAVIYQNISDENKDGKMWTASDISAGDVENILCCGIPKTANGNLQKASSSLLGKQFNQRRLSRQRIDQVLKGQAETERFDLITLVFFLYAQKEEIEDPVIRYEEFVKEINEMLESCGMMRLYSVNPYECFIQMCLLTEDPLSVYSDIWEMSYDHVS